MSTRLLWQYVHSHLIGFLAINPPEIVRFSFVITSYNPETLDPKTRKLLIEGDYLITRWNEYIKELFGEERVKLTE